jgi:hypothetical protein
VTGGVTNQVRDGGTVSVNKSEPLYRKREKPHATRTLHLSPVYNKMPPQRSILGSISGNRAFNHQLSPYQRGKIIGLTHSGEKSRDIQSLLNGSRGAVRSTLKLDSLGLEGNTQLRSGRPKCYLEATERKILQHVRLHPKDTYTQVILACELTIKSGTIKSILSQHGITNWRARRRPLLTEANAAKRLAWCLQHRGLTQEEWGMYMWSDECSVKRRRGKRDKWVFRTANQAWD